MLATGWLQKMSWSEPDSHGDLLSIFLRMDHFSNFYDGQWVFWKFKTIFGQNESPKPIFYD
jgi:hypothetical protein